MVARAEPAFGFGPLEHVRPILERAARLACDGAPHRLVVRFDVAGGALGLAVALERRHLGRWASDRPASWIALTPETAGVFALLLYVGEHGRLPMPAPRTKESSP